MALIHLLSWSDRQKSSDSHKLTFWYLLFCSSLYQGFIFPPTSYLILVIHLYICNPELNCSVDITDSVTTQPGHKTHFISRQQDLQTTVSDVFLLDSVYEVIWPIIADLSLTLGFYICFVDTFILLQPLPQASSKEKPKWETAELKEFFIIAVVWWGAECVYKCVCYPFARNHEMISFKARIHHGS